MESVLIRNSIYEKVDEVPSVIHEDVITFL